MGVSRDASGNLRIVHQGHSYRVHPGTRKGSYIFRVKGAFVPCTREVNQYLKTILPSGGGSGSREAPHLEGLPTEIQSHILKRLSKDDLKNLTRTSKRTSQMTQTFLTELLECPPDYFKSHYLPYLRDHPTAFEKIQHIFSQYIDRYTNLIGVPQNAPQFLCEKNFYVPVLCRKLYDIGGPPSLEWALEDLTMGLFPDASMFAWLIWNDLSPKERDDYRKAAAALAERSPEERRHQWRVFLESNGIRIPPGYQQRFYDVLPQLQPLSFPTPEDLKACMDLHL